MSNFTHESCDLHDHLENIATLKQECRLAYINREGKLVDIQGQIVDIYAADGLDWCQFSNGSKIRIDKIETISYQ